MTDRVPLLDYAAPADDAAEAAAAWRVAWWAGVIWAAGSLVWAWPTAWWYVIELFPTRRGGYWGGRAFDVANFGLFVATVWVEAALVLGRSRRSPSAVRTAAAVALAVVLVRTLLLAIISVQMGFTTFKPLLAVAILAEMPIYNGGLIVLAAVAWRPACKARRCLARLVALVLLALPAADAVYFASNLPRPFSASGTWQELRGWASWDQQAGPALALVAAAGVLAGMRLGGRRLGRGLFVLAAAAVVAGGVVQDWAFLGPQFWTGQAIDGEVRFAVAGGVVAMAAPALALLAWRAPPEPGR